MTYQYLTLHQAHKKSNLSKYKLRTAIKKGELKAKRENTSRGTEYRIKEKDLKYFLVATNKNMTVQSVTYLNEENYSTEDNNPWKLLINSQAKEIERLHNVINKLMDKNNELLQMNQLKTTPSQSRKLLVNPHIKIEKKKNIDYKKEDSYLSAKVELTWMKKAKKTDMKRVGDILQKTFNIH